MAGERWLEVKALVAGIDVQPLQDAADNWGDAEVALETVRLTTKDPDTYFDIAQPVGRAARYLTRGAKQVEDLLSLGLFGGSPSYILVDLILDIIGLSRRMEREEAGGVLGFGAFPDPSYEPATAAGSIIRDETLRVYDEKAEVYLRQLHELVANTAARLDRTYDQDWPMRGLPDADPEGPRPTG